MLKHIEISEEFGVASGYVVASDKVQISNYLSNHTNDFEIIADWLKKNTELVGLLKNINVFENRRGQGYGNDLIGQFLDEAISNSANAVILIADAGEEQPEGFVLESWYESQGFIAVNNTSCGSFMVFPEEIGEALKEHMASK